MSLKLHSNQYPNHLQIPRIHKIAETRLIPLSTRGGEEGGEGVGKQMWWWQLNFYTKDLLHSILYCLLQSKICPATENPTANWVPVFSCPNKNKWISRTSVHAHNLSQPQKMRSWRLGFQWVLRRVPEILTRRQTSWKNTITTTQKRGFRDAWVGWVDKGRSLWEQKSRDRYHAAVQIHQQQ